MIPHKGFKMKQDRLGQMKQLYYEKKNISNRELCETFNISLETVRRDLKQLEQEGVVKRVYGGAVLRPENDTSADMEPWHVRSVQNQREKAQIAAEMLLRIPDGCTIALDSGTSIFELAKLLNQKEDLTIITNSIHIALEISTRTNHTLYFIGGAIKKDELITTGMLSVDFLNCFSRIDLAIVSTDGFNVNEGLTDFNIEMGMLKRSIFEKANKILVAADYSKFSINALYKTCSSESLDLVITDPKAPAESVEYLRSAGVDVVIASAGGEPTP